MFYTIPIHTYTLYSSYCYTHTHVMFITMLVTYKIITWNIITILSTYYVSTVIEYFNKGLSLPIVDGVSFVKSNLTFGKV